MIWLGAVWDLCRRYAAVFSQAWRNRSQLESVPRRRDELEFLPAALALQETPVSPAPRVAMWLLIGFAMLGILWSILGKVEVVAVAEGKIVVGDRSKVVQPMEAAVVKAIFVKDGQRVRAGQVLIELDSTIADADTASIQSDLLMFKLDTERARAMLRAIDSGKPSELISPEARDREVYKQGNLLFKGQYEEYQAKLGKLVADAEAQQATLKATQAVVDSLEQTVPIIQQRAMGLKRLSDQSLISKYDYLQVEQQRLEQEANLDSQKKRIDGVQAALRSINQEQLSLTKEARRQALATIEERNQKVVTLEQELRKATVKGGMFTLRSPVTGTVQQLVTHTVGGVVTTAQPLMTIVPDEGGLEIEAIVANKDVGFVREGQDATVKVATFPYTKYGTIDGTVVSVSKDAINDEKLGPIYAMRVKMHRDAVYVDSQRVGLGAGMATTVEVKTGTRRVIEYFLAPFLQRTSESLRER